MELILIILKITFFFHVEMNLKYSFNNLWLVLTVTKYCQIFPFFVFFIFNQPVE